MLIRTILNRVHPIKGFVYGTVRMEDRDGRQGLHVSVRPRRNGRARCSKCQRRSSGYDHLPSRSFEFIPMWNMRVVLWYAPRRVRCVEHGIVVEHMPWARGKEHTTLAFSVFLARWAGLLSWQEVARRFKTSWGTVYEAVKRVVDYGLEHQELEGVSAVGFDEMAIGKGHDYVTMAYQLDENRRRLLWIGRERKAKTLLRFFEWFGARRSGAIQFVCTDMWQPYLSVIARKIPQALNVLDRFHIMKKFGEAIDMVRRHEVHRLHDKGLAPVLTKTRWILLKNPDNLTDPQRGRLSQLLSCNLQSVRAYLLREDFQEFWRYLSPYWAGCFLDSWVRRVMLSKIEPMKKVARMLRAHRPLLMNWFWAGRIHSSGVVEALNNSAKLTIRKSYGFKHFETLKYALYLKLGALPIPKLAHEFF